MRRTISKELLLEYALEGACTRRGHWQLNPDAPYDSECECDQLDADIRNLERRIKLQQIQTEKHNES